MPTKEPKRTQHLYIQFESPFQPSFVNVLLTEDESLKHKWREDMRKRIRECRVRYRDGVRYVELLEKRHTNAITRDRRCACRTLYEWRGSQ